MTPEEIMPVRDLTSGKIKEHTNLLLCVDGGCEPKNPGGVATSGWVIYENGQILVDNCRVVQDGGELATNNYAEYCALGFALRWLKDQGWKGHLTVQADSQLLIKQVGMEWHCKAKHLMKLRDRIWELMDEMGLAIGGAIQTFTCSGCGFRGSIDSLIDVDDDTDLQCPKCHTICIVFDGVPDQNKTPCILKWVPREKNQYANDLCRKAYQIYMREKNKKK